MIFIHNKNKLPTTDAKHVRWKPLVVKTGIALALLFVVAQLLYPSDWLLPLSNVDNQAVGMMSKKQAIEKTNLAYDNQKIEIFLGTSTKPFSAPTLKDVGITVDNTARINSINYPWYLRLVPGSIFWASLKRLDEPSITHSNRMDKYVDDKLINECRKQPVNASLKTNGDQLVVVPAISGGQCERSDVLAVLKKVKPESRITAVVRVNQKELLPEIDDKIAQKRAGEINERLSVGMPLQVGNERAIVPAKEIVLWLDFVAQGKELLVRANVERAGSFLTANIAAKVTINPGVSFIKTLDFTEISRVNGSNGQALDIAKTISTVQAFIDRNSDNAQAVLAVVPPTEQYTRSYSPTDAGLSALLANYAKDHSGTFGISLIEMDGKKRRANYNGDQQFVTASTYKLFVAYSLLKRIDAGTKDWESNANCFNKMISLSDNSCAEAFLNSIGLTNVTKDINLIGLNNSNFTKAGGPYTTANDLSLLLGMLQSGQNFSALNRERLINAMKNNVYRKGIPSGASGVVADKVGFIDDLLHDGAIVYSPNGTYVLVVMTKGSSWATIADLAKQIDTLRAR